MPRPTSLFNILLTTDDTTHADAFVTLNRTYVDLNLKSNGKMTLYFHAYFWTAYLSQLLKKAGLEQTSAHQARLAKFAQKPKQVADMV